MQKIYNLGHSQFVHYFKPGVNLDDISLKKLHANLVKVNEKSGSNISHKMLIKTSSIEEIRENLKNVIIAFLMIDNTAFGFLISPILNFKTRPILHAGLIIVEKNPGGDLISTFGLGNYIMAYENLGAVYLTNISSTPSIIEGFIENSSKGWPGPDVGVKKAPPEYVEVVKTLKSDYMDVYFPDADKCTVDFKRFILTSNSLEMGFTTNYYKTSRANDFKYNVFCLAWVDYHKEEDVIQVAELSFMTYLRARFTHYKLKQMFKNLSNRKMNSDSTKKNHNDQSKNDEKKSA